MSVRRRQEWISQLFILLLFLRLGSTTDYFKIFRRRSAQPGSQQDSFQTPQSLCGTASNYYCHDYGAQQTTCTTCTCPRSNDTFRYTHAQWKCIGKSELRQETGCLVRVRGELQSQPLLIVRSGSRYYIDLPMDQSCSYSYPTDTYYQTCNGTWLAAGGIGSGSRYSFHVIKQRGRYRYWLSIKTDSQAVNVLQGRIMKVNITCSTRTGGSIPWSTCFLFKESYFNTSISCPIYQALMKTTIATPTPSLPPNSTLVKQTVQSTESTGTSTLSPTSTSHVLLTSSAANVTHHHQSDKEAKSSVDKKIAISVSAAIGGLLVVIVTIICIVIYCKRCKRKSAAMYTAALYNASQDQCSAGIYDETNINLPSALKSASLMSHSNPAYGRGQELSISVKSSRHASSPSRLELQPDEPEMVDGSKILENESMFTDATAAQPIKRRRNMIVAYENVIVLRQDTPRESVPDAEAFYENPGTYSPHYHVLENLRDSRDVSNSASYPSGSHMDQESQGDFHHDSSEEEEDQNSYNDTYTNDDQPIYTSPPSPLSTAGSMRDGNFSFEQPDTNYYQDEEYEASFDGAQEHSENWDIYANSEAIRNSHLEDGAINNPGYMSDEEDERNTNPNISTDEPIYDNQIDLDDGHNKSGATPYALLRDQPKEGVYEDLRGNKSGVTTSDYQSLSPVTTRKNPKTNKPKIKPRPARKQ